MAIVGTGPGPRTTGPRWLIPAAVAALLGGPLLGLVAYVLSEDDYRDTGISRWDAYGPAAQAAFWVTAALVVTPIGPSPWARGIGGPALEARPSS